MTERKPLNQEETWKYAERALTWHGWGSPVGAGIFLVGLGLAALLIRVAIVGM